MSSSTSLSEYWKCCQESEISYQVCGKRNVLEVSTCERCGHWLCDTCTLTTDPNAVPKEYPKPRDPDNNLVRRASVSLKRAGSILGRTDPNAKGNEKAVAREAPIAEGNENQRGVTYMDNEATLVRRASVSLKRAGTILSRKRRSLAGTSKLDAQAQPKA